MGAVYANAVCASLQTGNKKIQQRMGCKAALVRETTNSSSASSTTSATQSCADIGQKGGGSEEGLAKGLDGGMGADPPARRIQTPGFDSH
ncbi:hypothetical protein V8C42DRAFT_325587 [Trichoderma barbatum]